MTHDTRHMVPWPKVNVPALYRAHWFLIPLAKIERARTLSLEPWQKNKKQKKNILDSPRQKNKEKTNKKVFASPRQM